MGSASWGCGALAHRFGLALFRFRGSPTTQAIFGKCTFTDDSSNRRSRAWLAPARYVAFIVIIALILDGLDGTVAILRNQVSLRGAVLDSTADRVVEVAWLVALWRCGVPL